MVTIPNPGVDPAVTAYTAQAENEALKKMVRELEGQCAMLRNDAANALAQLEPIKAHNATLMASIRPDLVDLDVKPDAEITKAHTALGDVLDKKNAEAIAASDAAAKKK